MMPPLLRSIHSGVGIHKLWWLIRWEMQKEHETKMRRLLPNSKLYQSSSVATFTGWDWVLPHCEKNFVKNQNSRIQMYLVPKILLRVFSFVFILPSSCLPPSLPCPLSSFLPYIWKKRKKKWRKLRKRKREVGGK